MNLAFNHYIIINIMNLSFSHYIIINHCIMNLPFYTIISYFINFSFNYLSYYIFNHYIIYF